MLPNYGFKVTGLGLARALYVAIVTFVFGCVEGSPDAPLKCESHSLRVSFECAAELIEPTV